MPEHPEPEQLERMLLAGAEHGGTYPVKAAVHLLVFTELIRHRRFVDQLEFLEITDPAGEPATAAFVRDWTTLLDGPTAHLLGGGATRLLTLAMALATGHPVDLRDNLRGFGHAHARRAVEAVALATGYPATPTLGKTTTDLYMTVPAEQPEG